ncbi:hypothetical protein PTKIN_Ptkin11bG0090200 [Pterospermum kingtungense]
MSNRTFKNRNKNKAPPEAGSSWPVVGHLHLLGGPKPPHIVLGDMEEEHGPIFTIKIGVHRALVVSNCETAKECLTTNDKAFATRPKMLATELLSYNYAMIGFAPYGPYWRQMRKVATFELLSNYRLDRLRHVRQSEIKMSLQELYQLWNKRKDSSKKVLVEMKNWFMDVTLNVILRMVVGKRIPSSGGQERLMKKVMKELDEVAEGWLRYHKRKRSDSGELMRDEDFMDVMLSILTDGQNHDVDTINKATCLALILAASDTTMVTPTWALSLLLNNRSALRKAQEELGIHVGKDKLVEESDIKELVYLQAVIKETLHLYLAGRLSVPHESMEDCVVSGYHIPAGTQLFINLHMLQRDQQKWSDPYEFQPKRFLSSKYLQRL